ncbi:MAG: arsenate reductase family protein [Campylobacterota bacterium]|nr:arsenate reductase family protein [Campylobacterota bacterium]
MINIYGIKTCSTVRKAIKFCKDKELEYQFIDFRETPLKCEKIKYFASKVDINILFNNRGTKYKDLKLKDLNLDENGKLEWLCKENMLLKRPVVEYENKVLVSFNDELYTKELLNK